MVNGFMVCYPDNGWEFAHLFFLVVTGFSVCLFLWSLFLSVYVTTVVLWFSLWLWFLVYYLWIIVDWCLRFWLRITIIFGSFKALTNLDTYSYLDWTRCETLCLWFLRWCDLQMNSARYLWLIEALPNSGSPEEMCLASASFRPPSRPRYRTS